MSLKDKGKFERKKVILNKIEAKEAFTLATLANELGVTRETVIRDIKELKKAKKIKFVGSKRSGHYKILRKD